MSSPVAAEQEDSSESTAIEECEDKVEYGDEESEVLLTPVEGDEADEAIATALDAIADGGVVTNYDEDGSLNEKDAKVNTVEADGGTFTLVSFPVEGGYLLEVSNLSILFNQDGTVSNYSEALIKEVDGVGSIESHVNGELVHTEEIPPEYTTDENGLRTSYLSRNEKAACLAVALGIPGATALYITGACSAACAVPIAGTAVCVACIAGFVALAGTSTTAAVKCLTS